MKRNRAIGVILLMISLFLSCETSDIYFSKMNMRTNLNTQKIVNLRPSEYLNEDERTFAEKIMSNGFLNKDIEEYGYYNMYFEWEITSKDGLFLFSIATLGILQIFGVPYEIDEYTLTGYLDIFDSLGNPAGNYKRSRYFKKAVGYYYGRDNTKKAGEEFSELFREIQEEVNMQSGLLNEKLRRIGPVADKNREEASKNMLVYLSQKYEMRYPALMTWPRNEVDSGVQYSFLTLSRNIPENSRIAIVTINAEDPNEGALLLNELTVLFVNSKKYVIVDRRDLEEIKKEHSFQMSGEADDASIVSIGHFLGADVVITGSIAGEGSMKRLIVKALDVKTSQILAASSEKI
jgi:hypothetical protein